MFIYICDVCCVWLIMLDWIREKTESFIAYAFNKDPFFNYYAVQLSLPYN